MAIAVIYRPPAMTADQYGRAGLTGFTTSRPDISCRRWRRRGFLHRHSMGVESGIRRVRTSLHRLHGAKGIPVWSAAGLSQCTNSCRHPHSDVRSSFASVLRVGSGRASRANDGLARCRGQRSLVSFRRTLRSTEDRVSH